MTSGILLFSPAGGLVPSSSATTSTFPLADAAQASGSFVEYTTKRSGDAAGAGNYRIRITTDGTISWSDGAGGLATSVSLAATSVLSFSAKLSSDYNVVARAATAGQVQTGTLGPGGEAAVRLGGSGNDANDPVWYKAAAALMQTDHKTKFNHVLGVVLANAALATNATAGFTYLPSCAGAPSGVAATETGTVATVVDTTNSKLMAYIGGAWKGVTLT